MKKYKKLAVIPAVLIIAISVLSGFSNPDAEKTAISIVKERTDILQKTFYRQISLREAEKRLDEIETYPLLTEDIHSIREWEASQLDIVRRMNIVAFDQEKNYLNYIIYTAVIYWDMSGLSENYTCKGKYHVVMKRENDRYKLSVFNPIGG